MIVRRPTPDQTLTRTEAVSIQNHFPNRQCPLRCSALLVQRRQGYATDPAYAGKLIGLMDRYNLYRFDDV